MNIQSLRYFVAIAEGSSVSHAAEQLYITQPALSRSIQRLEDELRCKLFDRSTPTLQLTRQGEAILPIARQILCLADDISAVAQDYNYGRRSFLSIGCYGCETGVFYRLISLLHQHYPLMNITTPKLFSMMDALAGVLSKEIDCCFAYSGYQYSGGEQLNYIPMQETHLQLVLPNTHPFASSDQLPIQLLEHQKLLFWRRDMFPGYHNRFHESCQSFGCYPDIVGDFSNKQELFSKVAANRGLAVVYSGEIYRPENGSFSFVDLVTPDGELFNSCYISLFWNKRNDNPALPFVTALARENMPDCVF